jgi:hypothetical protein
MKKARSHVEDAQPTKRTDMLPTSGYTMIVDGHFKTEFIDEAAAKKAARDLLRAYPMPKIEIYDAGSKSRTSVKLKRSQL